MKHALITGASSGIGLECARRFLRDGWSVTAQYRSNAGAAASLAEEFGADRVHPVQAELGEERGCVAVAEACPRIDALVHSAGIWNAAPIRGLTAEALRRMFSVNTFSSYLLAREVVGRMGRGSLVFVGSTAGQRGEPGHSHYAGSKAALWGLVQSLAQELAPEIRVNLVSPGWVRTPMAEPALADPERGARIVEAIPLRRIALPEDVAAAVAFLVAEEQRHLTGVDLPVSGGALLPLPRG